MDSIKVAPEIWSRAMVIAEEIQKRQREVRAALGLDDTVDYSQEDVKNAMQQRPEALLQIMPLNTQIEVLQHVFWSILDQDPEIDVRTYAYVFDPDQQELHLKGVLPSQHTSRLH